MSVPQILSILIQAWKLGWSKRRVFGCWWHSVWRRRQPVRVSCAHLIRVRQGNMFLLVPSSRITYQMQPPGGVVQAFSDSRAFLESVGAQPGDDYSFSKKDDGDLRLHIPAKNLVKFLRWYAEEKGRETSPEREFREELVDPGILDKTLFESPRLQRYATRITGPQFSSHFGCWEVLIHEFFSLDATEEQCAHLLGLQEEQSRAGHVTAEAQFAWYTAQEIASGGRLPNAESQSWKVGEHAMWMLEGGE